MNKPTKPASPESTAKPHSSKQGSLLERASWLFGFDQFKPASVPVLLEGNKAQKFAPRRRASDHSRKTERAAAQTPVAQQEPVQKLPEMAAVTFTGDPRHIVRSVLGEQGLIDPDGGASKLLEEFRIVKRQVLATARAKGTPESRRVLICSPHPSEGKTFCALNLAISMAAEHDGEVLLVDADFAKPSILASLGLESAKGFMDVLADPSANVEDYVIATDIPGLWVLAAGLRSGRDSEYLASDRTREVLDRLTHGAPNRMIVFDSPPILAATPATELAKHVGQSLLVARAGETGKVALEDAIDLLAACPDIRLLLNDATFSPSGRRFGSYYGSDI